MYLWKGHRASVIPNPTLSFSSWSKWQPWIGCGCAGRAGGRVAVFLTEMKCTCGSARLSPEQPRVTQPLRGAERGWAGGGAVEPGSGTSAPAAAAAGRGSARPFFRLHFLGSLAPIERGTVAGDKSCIHCTNRALKRQYTESFFALCENWGGLYSPPLCRCLSTALFEASPIVPANVSYWPESVPAMFPGSKLRARECLKRGNRGLNAFCCIVVWPIKSKLRSAFMQTGNYVVTAAAIDIWLPPRGKRGWSARLSLQALKRWTLMILTENRRWISKTDRSTRWILYPRRQK